MAKRVIWTESARKSRRLILEYWIKETGNKKYSHKIARVLNQRIDTLRRYPEAGKLTNIENISPPLPLAISPSFILYLLKKLSLPEFMTHAETLAIF